MTSTDDFNLSCPVPAMDRETVQLAHGGGGRAMKQLIDTIIRPAFADPELDHCHDGAVLEMQGAAAFTT
ncbi:MAG: hydrogenase expression/formation protein HypE, partial [Alphaproteobacteria bacterium]|nr:hydrogenase expression/formation protein HypE [Alphaproteobacteria bacterium]